MLPPSDTARTGQHASKVGIDTAQHQAAPRELNLTGFVQEVARKYGVQLDHNTIGRLGSLFSNKVAMADPSASKPAVTQILRGSLRGTDTKPLKGIAGLACSYCDDSVGEVGVDRLMADAVEKMANNPALATSVDADAKGAQDRWRTLGEVLGVLTPIQTSIAATASTIGRIEDDNRAMAPPPSRGGQR